MRLLIVGLVCAGCGGSDPGADMAGCTKDTDCKGARICTGGVCVEVLGMLKPDAAVAPDLGGPDLYVPDLGEAPDLARLADLATPDLATAPDLTVAPDLAQSIDLAILPVLDLAQACFPPDSPCVNDAGMEVNNCCIGACGPSPFGRPGCCLGIGAPGCDKESCCLGQFAVHCDVATNKCSY